MVNKTRFRRSILLGLLSAGALTGAAQAAEAIRPMPLGYGTYGPAGFTAFCVRSAADCEVSQARAEAEDAVVGQVESLSRRSLILMALAGPQDRNALVRAALSHPASKPASAQRLELSYRALPVEAAPDAPQALSASEDKIISMSQALASPPPRASDQPLHVASAEWKLVKAVNTKVNRAIYRSTDQQTYGREEVWALPLQSGVTYGDCEDYVLEKRRALLQAGIDRRNLNIAVVTTWAGERHAVLLVRAAEGEFVLDNLTSRVLPWTKAGYDWNQRQVEGETYDWVEIGQPPSSRSVPLRRDLLIAALQ